ncbi:hypothetical protein QJS04_geneDACA006047 [Acorus gramineus]|uniref:Uncharacterized protein n=1 Tax=Acorus gramineus TaxID=55184 RepID=A0AAV9B230_ACOGR|nr:hypothetical protein QJS04_geneDACA006047 [Acorus gramineus]
MEGKNLEKLKEEYFVLDILNLEEAEEQIQQPKQEEEQAVTLEMNHKPPEEQQKLIESDEQKVELSWMKFEIDPYPDFINCVELVDLFI